MKKLIQLFSVLFAFILSLPIFSQQPAAFEGNLPENVSDWNLPTHSALPVPVSVDRGEVHPDLAILLQNTLDSMAEAMDMVGVGAALRTPEGDIWAGGSGISQNAPVIDSIDENHRLAIGSISKTLTAACILQLYEEGALHLDDTLGQHLPPYPNVNPSATIRQLLNHTSGIYNYTNNPQFFATIAADPAAVLQVWTAPEVLDTFVLNPDFMPGTSWNYSNTGYVLLGEIITAVTGNEYWDEIRMRFLEPLELNTIFLSPYDMWQQPTAHLWADFDGDGVQENNNDLFQSFNSLYTTAGAAGAYFSTPTDMVKWMWNLQAGDLLTPATLDEMRTFITLTSTFSYGLGTMRVPFFGKSGWGHGGDIFYAAGTYYIPDDEVTISVQTNHGAYNSNNLNPIIGQLLNTYSSFNPPTSTYDFELDFNITIAPNPFENQVRIGYSLPQTTRVQVSIYNMLGQEVKSFDSTEQSGQQVLIWDGANDGGTEVSDGSYFLKFEVGENVFLRKVLKQ